MAPPHSTPSIIASGRHTSRTGTPCPSRNRLTCPIVYVPKWKMLAAKAASACPVVSTSSMCWGDPAPPLATTGTLTASLTAAVISRSYPAVVPSAFITLRTISPAPRAPAPPSRPAPAGRPPPAVDEPLPPLPPGRRVLNPVGVQPQHRRAPAE